MKGRSHWSIKGQARLANKPKPSRSDSNCCNVIFQHGSGPPNSPPRNHPELVLFTVCPFKQKPNPESSFDSVPKTTSLLLLLQRTQRWRRHERRPPARLLCKTSVCVHLFFSSCIQSKGATTGSKLCQRGPEQEQMFW